MVKISYKIELHPMAQAGLTLLEHKGFMQHLLPWVNRCIGLALIIYPIKAWFLGLTQTEGMLFAWLIAWYFGRQRLNLLILRWRLKKYAHIGEIMRLTIDNVGLHTNDWHFPWERLAHAFQCQDGYIFSDQSGQFLWIPLHAVTPVKSEFEALLATAPIKIQALPKIRCGT